MLPETPSDLENGPVRLRYEKTVPGDASKGLVPYHHFEILLADGTEVGHINFRIGDTRHVTMTAGHIGYGIVPEHRGHAYSYHACLALAPFVRRHYDRVVLTVDPQNVPSIRIIERLGATFLDQVDVPADDPAFEKGARTKLRYCWVP